MRKLTGFFVLLLIPTVAFALTVDPPLRVTIPKIDKTQISGFITAYDDNGMTVMDLRKQMQTVTWDQLEPGMVYNMHARLMGRGTAAEWFKVGKLLLTMPGGRPAAERAFARTLYLDRSYKDQIIEARKDAVLAPPHSTSTTEPSSGAAPTTRDALDPRDPNKPVMGPQISGEVDESAWGKQSPRQMAEAIAGLKAFAQTVTQKIDPKLAPYETRYFLFYSDMTRPEAQKWVMVLDRMYARLAELFHVAPNENIWHGKALVFVFQREEDYLNFEIKMHGTVAAGTAGMCHGFGSGDVHIAFYRQPNDLDFAHVLVHESVHGFVYRYRSSKTIPSWVNEGLAETIASELVPQPGITQSGTAQARADLQTRRSLGDMFTAEHIVAWQYPVARTLTEFMIHQSRTGYVAFINGMKDGLSWKESLSTKYGVSAGQLVSTYGNFMGVNGLRDSAAGLRK